VVEAHHAPTPPELCPTLSSPPDDLIKSREIPALYRCRWQIELAFKRLESLLKHLPKRDSKSFQRGYKPCPSSP